MLLTQFWKGFFIWMITAIPSMKTIADVVAFLKLEGSI